ncbi:MULTISPECIES: hypothetical protein [Nitrosomonas]|nr:MULTISPECIES: hypothetical protein [Nitrosomonas]UVS60077.1 hypothetical protein NX761_11095 [Nitrosomonas sp. PLL12]
MTQQNKSPEFPGRFSTGLLNLVCIDVTCNGEYVATIYQKR